MANADPRASGRPPSAYAARRGGDAHCRLRRVRPAGSPRRPLPALPALLWIERRYRHRIGRLPDPQPIRHRLPPVPISSHRPVRSRATHPRRPNERSSEPGICPAPAPLAARTRPRRVRLLLCPNELRQRTSLPARRRRAQRPIRTPRRRTHPAAHGAKPATRANQPLRWSNRSHARLQQPRLKTTAVRQNFSAGTGEGSAGGSDRCHLGYSY